MIVVLGLTWAYEERDKLVTLQRSGLWDVSTDHTHHCATLSRLPDSECTVSQPRRPMPGYVTLVIVNRANKPDKLPRRKTTKITKTNNYNVVFLRC